jgi:hypothetical protein
MHHLHKYRTVHRRGYDPCRKGDDRYAAPRVVTRVTFQHNIKKYVPSNVAQFKMHVCRTGHILLTQNRVTYCSPKHDYNRKQKEVSRMVSMNAFDASHNLPMKRGPKRLPLTKISRDYQYQHACERNSEMTAEKC